MRMRRNRRQSQHPILTLLGHESEQCCVNAQRKLRPRVQRARRCSENPPTRYGVGSTRWNAWPSRPLLCCNDDRCIDDDVPARVDTAPSRPTIGIHGGSKSRIFWISLKKYYGPSIFPISRFAVAYDQTGAIHAPRHTRDRTSDLFGLVRLVAKYGWSRPSASSNMSSRNTPSYMPAAAIDEMCGRYGVDLVSECDRVLGPSTLIASETRHRLSGRTQPPDERSVDFAGELLNIGFRQPHNG